MLGKFITSRRQSKMYDVVIVGGGVSGAACLIQMIEHALAMRVKKLKLCIIEKSENIGPGLPYASNQNDTLKLNDPTNTASLYPHDPLDFVAWIQENRDKISGQYSGVILESGSLDSQITRFPPRNLFGRYCQDRTHQILERAKIAGYEIKILSSTSVQEIKKLSSMHWELILTTNEIVSSKQMILATGHLPSDKYRDLLSHSGYFESPWEDLGKIPKGEDVWILGSGLTAIDAAKILVANGHAGKIHLASPSGKLPTVKPPATKETYALKFLTEDHFIAVKYQLKEIIDLCNRELSEVAGIAGFNLHDYMAKDYNPSAWLSKQINIVEKGEIRPWQFVLDLIYFNVIPKIWPQLSINDKTAFLRDYYPPYMKWAAGTPIDNARELLEMLAHGQLILHGNLSDVKFDHATQQFSIRVGNEILETAYIINGTGPGNNIQHHALLNQLAAQNIVEASLHGGITVDTKTYRVINAGVAEKSLYAVGPIIFGSDPAVYAIEASTHAALKIAQNIIELLLASRDTEEKLKSRELPIFFRSVKPRLSMLEENSSLIENVGIIFHK
jgi:uncharacterized NAD(P)/FAD-binding protein YdhS